MGEIRKSVLVKHPTYDVSATIRASHDGDRGRHGGDFAETATVGIETGACTIQVYATAQQCRELAAMFATMADSIEAMPAVEVEAA